jgi:membrane associated rhomboid family serine protease
MRRPTFGPRPSATVVLLVANILAFIIQNVAFSQIEVLKFLALSKEGLQQGYLWQLLSFQFIHANLMHLLGNCLAIFFFGRAVEEAVGQKSFYALYFSSGVVGGLVQALAGVLLGGHFAGPVLGASAGAFGLTTAFSVLFPDSVILISFIIPVRAKYFLVGSIVLAVAGIAFPNTEIIGRNVAHAAHLGGILTGLLFIRYAVHWRLRWPQIQRPGRQPIRRLVKVHAQKPALWSAESPETDENLPSEEFLSKEVDPILDKISAQGIQSLTDRERRILEKARARMAKR